MAKLVDYLDNIDFTDPRFIGTVAFRNEEITLPDGSKMALGIDGGHWVLVYQKAAGSPFQVYEYNYQEKKISVDRKLGNKEDFEDFKNLIGYFFHHANTEELVTLLPPQVGGI